MQLRILNFNEKDIVLNLYNEAKKQDFCVWNDEYPTMEEIEDDFNTNNLFVLVDSDEIIGAISIVPINEMDDIKLWEDSDNACEIARIVISKKHQGKGLVKEMVKLIFPICKNKGFSSIHLSCQYDNLPANKTYQKLGFKKVGEKFMYGNNYNLLEIRLS